MPKPAQYRSGSLIYFQGDPAEKIFILQSGKVSLVYQDIETGADLKDPVQPGEFFGVKSALGHYPREENAIALSETAVMVFTVPEFEAVATANSRIILKMLKVFSNQMRRVHRQVSKLTVKEEVPPADGLYNVGEFYLKNKRFTHAKHVFSRYLTFYPSGKNAAQAAKNLEIAESALLRYGDGKGPGVSFASGNSSGNSFGNASGNASSNASGNASYAAAPPPEQTVSADPEKTTKDYYDAVSMISQGKYKEAYIAFKSIADSGSSPEWTAKSSFEMGRCLFLLDKYEDSLKHLTIILTKSPKHPNLKDAIFIMGQCNEKIGKKDQAAAFYKKVLSMGGNDDDGIITKAKRALSAMGV
jgi:TolA-binding protein